MALYNSALRQYFDGNGRPLSSGWIRLDEPGTSTLKTLYSDKGETITRANPVQLDGEGRVPVFYVTGRYDETLYAFNPSVPGDVGEQIDKVLDTPAVPTALVQFTVWDSTRTYMINDAVLGNNGTYYMSITDGNLNNDPVSSPANWSVVLFIKKFNTNESYSQTAVVQDQLGKLQISRTNSNQGNNPINDDSLTNWRHVGNNLSVFATSDVDAAGTTFVEATDLQVKVLGGEVVGFYEADLRLFFDGDDDLRFRITASSGSISGNLSVSITVKRDAATISVDPSGTTSSVTGAYYNLSSDTHVDVLSSAGANETVGIRIAGQITLTEATDIQLEIRKVTNVSGTDAQILSGSTVSYTFR